MNENWLNVIHAPGDMDKVVKAVFCLEDEYDGVRMSEWSGCPRGTAIVIDKHMNISAWDLTANEKQ